MVQGALRHGIRRVLFFSAVGGLLLTTPAGGEPPEDATASRAEDPRPSRAEAATPSRAEDAAPPVALDNLLRLPPSTAVPQPPRRGGDGPSEWRARFARARGELEVSERALAEAQAELGKLASESESWQVAAPGGQAGADTGPLSYGLRQEIRRQREAVARAERELEELRIEANLAGVPEEWTREAPAEGAAPDPAPAP